MSAAIPLSCPVSPPRRWVLARRGRLPETLSSGTLPPRPQVVSLSPCPVMLRAVAASLAGGETYWMTN